jgi:hypothetical protein
MSQVDETLFDVRHVERFIAEGRITQQQYNDYLESLEDCSKNADDSAVRMQATYFRASPALDE